MNTSSKPSYLIPILLFGALIVALQGPQIMRMIWPETLPEPAFAWQHDFQQAQQSAKASQKNLMVVFSASWCPPCKMMKREVWSAPEVGQVVESAFVPVYIDIDQPEHDALSEKYKVDSIPAIFVMDSSGNVLARRMTMGKSDAIHFLTQEFPAVNQ